jgi:hypothetical protein
MNKIIGFGLLAVGAWLFVRKGIVAQRTNWRFGGFSANWKKKVINVTLFAGNPIGDSLTLQSLSGDLYLVGRPIASISTFDKQTIAPFSESPIKLVMRPNLAGLASTALALIKSGTQNLKGKLRFVGTANVQNIPVPIDTTFA